MPEWFNTPLIIIATMAVGTGLIRFGQWMGSVNSDRDVFKEFMRDIRNDIKEIRASITGIFARLPASPIAGESPYRLTDLGRAMSDSLGGRAWAERVAPSLSQLVRGREPYEVQDICFGYVRNEFTPTDEQDARIRACAYENALSRDQVLDVLAVELRDILLEVAEPATAA